MPQLRPADLPDFRLPPVVEVYLSIQFEPISGFDATLMSACCSEFAATFPKVRYQQPLGHDLEVFSPSPPVLPAFQLQIGGTADISVRLALTSADGARLLQIQSDRLVHNWRRQGSETNYPRYEAIREAFEEHAKTFLGLVARSGLADPVIDQCEISYINRIEAPVDSGGYAGADRVFSQLRSTDRRDSLPRLEDLGFRARYIIEDGDHRPIGRLHTLAQPEFRDGNATPPAFRFNLMTRGRPSLPTLNSSMNFFDLGRRTIVRAFAALTTPEMHQLWGRTDVA
jgi:uncharacterized protein (TIGR04255 family)